MKKLLLFICLTLSLVACKTTKNVANPTVDWDKAVIPFKLSFEHGMSVNGKGYFERGRSIYISLRYIGMEVMSFYANNDSVYLYDKSRSMLVADKLGINPLTHRQLDVNQLQDFLLGINNYAYSQNYNFKNVKIFLTPGENVTSGNNTLLIDWLFTVVDTDEERAAKGNIQWNYSGAEYNDVSLPQWKMPKNPRVSIPISDIDKVLNSGYYL